MTASRTYYAATWVSADFQRCVHLTTEADFDALGEAVAEAIRVHGGRVSAEAWEGVAAQGRDALLAIGERIAAERGLGAGRPLYVGSKIRSGKQPTEREMLASLAGSKGSTGGDWFAETGEE